MNNNTVPYIAAPLRGLAVEIASLSLDPHNVRIHGDDDLAALAASLSAFGQRRPIVVQRSTRVVRAGNGIVQAAQRLGWSHVAALVVDDDDSTARAFAIADNKTGTLAGWDDRALASALSELSAEWADYNPTALGFTQQEILRLVTEHIEFADDPFDDPGDTVTLHPLSAAPAVAEDEAPTAPARPAARPAAPAVTMQLVSFALSAEEHSEFLVLVRALAVPLHASDVAGVVMASLRQANDARTPRGA